MPCINDNNNGFYTGPYYPRPFFIAPENQSGSNNVVNPARSEEWGFFVGLPTTVANGGTVPLTLNASTGTAVSQQNAGVVSITTGSYQVSYNITASSATDPMQFGVELNGTILPFTVVTATSGGSDVTLSNSVIITAPSNSTLRLVNLTAGNADVAISSMAVTKLLN